MEGQMLTVRSHRRAHSRRQRLRDSSRRKQSRIFCRTHSICTTWNSFIANSGTDNYRWNATTKTVEAGSDGLVEVNLFPQGTGSPGNRGTVDIGSSNNSTADIARQIVYGISPADLAHHGGKLAVRRQRQAVSQRRHGHQRRREGRTGIDQGPTANHSDFFERQRQRQQRQYTIVKWQGIRIMNVKLTGSMSQKNVMIQVAPAEAKGVIPSTTTGTSSYVYSPVVLVR